ncbi:hypothetical protein BUALT_Bualt02G0240100 [Buddleja alternifolia]|uniref:Uncharacterized protein n=1 Tax=Buddleja alternifolia TaxID=168488 RepID=A0AAV6YAU5_9LAMI|nr:hypothetical protein BUALT_Bualt02G0240100 [Buddleja alternifolia]
MTEFMPTNDNINTENVKIESTIAVVPTAVNTQSAADKPPIDVERRKKKRGGGGGFGIFKAALFMLRARPAAAGEKEKKKSIGKQNSITASNNANWTKLVGSMRPLHMQEVTESPPSSVAPDSPPPMKHHQQQPESPATSSSGGTMSQYASASSLRDLYNSSDEEDEEEEDPDEVFDAICGDEMIDAKAEEFIAQFYKQIQLQKTAASHHHRHNHRRN